MRKCSQPCKHWPEWAFSKTHAKPLRGWCLGGPEFRNELLDEKALGLALPRCVACRSPGTARRLIKV